MSLPISIVITNYNRERYLGDAIASVLQQTWQDLELIVWDDGSTDDSVAIALQYAQRDRRVCVVQAPHQGKVLARQSAIAQTKGKYFGWVDSDDILAPTALAETVTLLHRHPEMGFVYTDYVDIDENKQVIRYGDRCRIPYSQERMLVDFMSFQFRLIRRQTYDLVQGFHGSPNYAEDYDLCLRLSEVGKVGRIQKPLYYYRQHACNISQIHKLEVLLCSQQAINQAIKRRGLADKYQIDLDVSAGRFVLQHKPSFRNFISKVGNSIIKALFPLALAMNAGIAQGQIVPAVDGTGTIVTPNGNILDIHGGTTSNDGANLFHSFQQFGLTPEQIANFQANPNLQNILGRITGGNPSIINGLIQVTGGNPNLFLMNPAGFVFGANANLNVPGAFTVTTANGISFGNNWFNATGTNNYSTLVGNPTGFAFTMNQPGAIFNAGNLAVGTGQSLNLLSGTVINNGVLSAQSGKISVTAVPGQSWIRLSQPGNLLSLEVESLAGNSNQPTNWNIPIAALPELLTVGNTGIIANADSSVKLPGTNTNVPTNPGTTIVSGKVDVSGTTGGTVNILGTKVGLVGADINASGNNGGGNVLIGGDYRGEGTVPNAERTYIDARSQITANSNLNGNGGRVIVWGNDTTQFFGKIAATGGTNFGNGGFVEVSGKNNLLFQGNVDLSAVKGSLGNLLLDPTDINIVDSAPQPQDAFLPTILQDDTPATFTISKTALETQTAAITLEASNNITVANGVSLDFISSGTDITFTADADNSGAGSFIMDTTQAINTNGRNITITGASLTLGNLDTTASFSGSGSVNLSATGDISAGNIVAVGNGYGDSGSIDVTSSNGAVSLGILNTNSGEFFDSAVNAGAVTINAAKNILTSDINSAFNSSFLSSGTGGAVELTSTAGSITTGLINSSVTKNNPGDFDGIAGAVNLTAANQITTTAGINSSATFDIGEGSPEGTVNLTAGNIAITSTSNNGEIKVGNLNSNTSANTFSDVNNAQAGTITLSSISNITCNNITCNNIITGNINSSVSQSSESATSGDVSIITNLGSITTGNINSSVFKTQGGGDFTGTSGAVNLNAAVNITTAVINTRATAFNIDGDATLQAGNVTLETTNPFGSAIQFSTISSQATTEFTGSNLQGGNVQVLTNGIIKGTGTTSEDSTGDTIVTGEIIELGDGITTSTEGGTITIQHDGGPDNVDFIVGDSTFNGTTGALNIGGTTRISAGKLSSPVLPNGGPNTTTPTGITINSVNSPPTITANTTLPATETNQSVEFTLAYLVPKPSDIALVPKPSDIASDIASDINKDNITIQINVVNADTLTVNDIPVSGVTTIKTDAPLDTLEYTPPKDTNGLLNALTISASDKVSTSAPIQIQINVTEPPPPDPVPPPPDPVPPPPDPVPPPPDPVPPPPDPVPPPPDPVPPPPDPDPKPDVPPCTFQCNETPPNPIPNPPKNEISVLDSNPIPEGEFTARISNYLGVSSPRLKSPDEAREIAVKIEQATGVKPAFIYISFVPVEIAPNELLGTAKSKKQLDTSAEQDNQQLELVIVTGKGEPIRRRVPEATKAKVLAVAKEFRDQITNPQNRRRKTYLTSAQQLYRWLIAPLDAELQAKDINNLVFLPDIGLRSTPMAALHDGKGFLVEKYSIGLMPSLSLTNTLYTDIKKSQVLALGVSQSTQGQEPLPAVPVELSTLVSKLWEGKLLLDKQATLENLKAIRRQQPFGIIHMATHADFSAGELSNSYIQLWEDKLRLNQIRELRLNEPQVEMMVLSACRTALGNEEAEIGFAGLAVLAGVKTSVASLWAVNDVGTAALMTKFYEDLKTAPIRAEALRQAQVAMATGKVYIKNGQIFGLEPVQSLALPGETSDRNSESLSHPYYWAGFTMVGNPW